MPDVLAGAISQPKRAVRAWKRIQRDPSSIAVERSGNVQTAQTVRIEFSIENNSYAGQGQNTMPSKRDLIIFGVRNHPTVTDTDLERGDRFVIGTSSYEITDVNDIVPGEVQADAVRLS